MSKIKDWAIQKANEERSALAERFEKEANDAFEEANSVYDSPDDPPDDDDDDGDWPMDRAF